MPFQLILNMIKGVLNGLVNMDLRNFILDGILRDLSQGEALTESGIKVNKVLYLDIPDETMVERVTQRSKQNGKY